MRRARRRSLREANAGRRLYLSLLRQPRSSPGLCAREGIVTACCWHVPLAPGSIPRQPCPFCGAMQSLAGRFNGLCWGGKLELTHPQLWVVLHAWARSCLADRGCRGRSCWFSPASAGPPSGCAGRAAGLEQGWTLQPCLGSDPEQTGVQEVRGAPHRGAGPGLPTLPRARGRTRAKPHGPPRRSASPH